MIVSVSKGNRELMAKLGLLTLLVIAIMAFHLYPIFGLKKSLSWAKRRVIGMTIGLKNGKALKS